MKKWLLAMSASMAAAVLALQVNRVIKRATSYKGKCPFCYMRIHPKATVCCHCRRGFKSSF